MKDPHVYVVSSGKHLIKPYFVGVWVVGLGGVLGSIYIHTHIHIYIYIYARPLQ